MHSHSIYSDSIVIFIPGRTCPKKRIRFIFLKSLMRLLFLACILLYSYLVSLSQNRRGAELVITDSVTAQEYKKKLQQERRTPLDIGTRARYYRLLSDYYYKLGKSDSMLLYIENALALYEQTTDTFHIYYCRFRIADEQLASGRGAEMMDFFKEAAAYYERTGESGMAVNCHLVLSRIYRDQKKQANRSYHLNYAFSLNSKAKDTTLQLILLNSRCKDEQDENNWKAAVKTATTSLQLASAYKKPHFIKSALLALGNSYFLSGEVGDAIPVYEQALTIKAVEPTDHLNAAAYLVQSYSRLGMHPQAEAAFLRYQHIRDSIEHVKTTDRTNELLAKYETDKKQAALALLQKENELNRQAATARKTWIIILLVFIVLFVPVSLLAVFNIRKRQQLEKVNEVRNKISRDLHDEVGALLSSIEVYAAVAEKSMQQQEEQAHTALRKIRQNTSAAMDNMSDIVWAIKSYTTDETTLTDKLKNYGYEILTPRSINCIYTVDPEAEKKLVNVEARRNILLIAKEAVNNAAKHSGASEVRICVREENGLFFLEISDNGKGMDAGSMQKGNGLQHMKQRAEILDGSLVISQPGEKGTRITCKIPVTKINS